MKILRPQASPHPFAIIGLLLAAQACFVVLGNAWLHVDIVHVGLLLAGGVLLSAAVGRVYVRRRSLRSRHAPMLEEGVCELRAQGSLVGRSQLVEWVRARVPLEHVDSAELEGWVDSEARAVWDAWYTVGRRVRPSVVRVPSVRRLAGAVATLWAVAAIASCVGWLPLAEVPGRPGLTLVEGMTAGWSKPTIGRESVPLLLLTGTRPAHFYAVTPVGELPAIRLPAGYHVRIAVARASIDAVPWRTAGQWGDAWAIWHEGREVLSYERSRFDYPAFGSALLFGAALALVVLLVASNGRQWSL